MTTTCKVTNFFGIFDKGHKGKKMKGKLTRLKSKDERSCATPLSCIMESPATAPEISLMNSCPSLVTPSGRFEMYTVANFPR